MQVELSLAKNKYEQKYWVVVNNKYRYTIKRYVYYKIRKMFKEIKNGNQFSKSTYQ